MNNKVYRLLRNNKEEGPYTAQEIISKGLKPYDLIWVDGRSAGWNYPGEMKEFKLLVATPGAELQNRISRNNAAVSSTVQAAVSVNDNLMQAKQPKPRYKVSAAWSKIQTITAPPVYDNLLVAEPKKSSTTKRLVVSNHNNTQQAKSLSWEQAWKDWEVEKTGSLRQPEIVMPSSINAKKNINETVKQQAPVLETKFKQSLDTLTDSYIDNLIKQKKRAKSFSFGKASEFVLPSIALVVIFSIGYWLMNSKSAASVISPVTKQQQNTPVQSSAAPGVNAAPVNTTKNNGEQKNTEIASNATTTEVKSKSNTIQKTAIVTPAVINTVALNSNNSIQKNNSTNNVTDVDLKKTSNATTKQFDPSVINNVPNDKAYNDAASANNGDLNAAENRPVRRRTNAPDNVNAAPQKNQSTYSSNNTDSKSSAKYVSVPEYVPMNDGSGNVKIQNVSDVDLDLVVVDVMYYDHSGQFKKGETLYLHNLKAGKALTIKTPRDVNAEYATSKVSLVSSDANGVYAIGDN